MNTVFVVFKYLFTYNISWWSNSRTSFLLIEGVSDKPLLTKTSIEWGKNSGKSDV